MSNYAMMETCPEPGCGKRRFCENCMPEPTGTLVLRYWSPANSDHGEVTLRLERCERCRMALSTPLLEEHLYDADAMSDDGIGPLDDED